MKRYIIKYSIATLFAAMIFASCDNYLDVNDDKDNPTVAELDLLLTNTQVAVGAATDFQFYTGDILQVYTHQMCVREEQDQYGTKVDNILLKNEWDNIYLTLNDLNTLINQGVAEEAPAYVGIAQMQKAYLMSVAVDLWGDVPYNEATKLEQGVISPVFDNQEQVYDSILNLIDEAKVNLVAESLRTPGTDDLFYGGDMEKWTKFANTFKLKLYNQIRSTPLFDVAEFNALLTENNFFTSADDDFEFTHTSNTSPSDERNRFYVASYGSTQFSTYMSPWFYEILMGMNPDIHNGNPDPRIPYYFFNQLQDGEFPPDQGDAETGNPKADYWDASTGFFSIRFGSVGPWRDSSAENSYTYPGIFPCGGRFDDNQGGIMDINGGTGIAPKRILTYDEMLYTQAELILAGLMAGDAAAKLEEAMTASFAKVDIVVEGTGTTQSVPALLGSTEATGFIAGVLAEYGAGDAAKKLEIIMTQKWVATFGDPMDQYNDYRRTGFPVLADPNGPSPEYQLDNGDGFPLVDSQTVLNNPFQVSLFWPQSELNANANAPSQKNPATYFIFWDN